MENIIYAYTRKQAAEEGQQVDVSTKEDSAPENVVKYSIFL